MTSDTLTPQPELEKLALRFAEWRAHRQSKREKIPSELLDQVLELTKTLSRNKVLARLGISGGQLKKHLQEKGQVQSEIEFVPVPKDTASAETTSALPFQPQAILPTVTSLTFELSRTDGSKLTITGLPLADMDALVDQFMGVTPCCN